MRRSGSASDEARRSRSETPADRPARGAIHSPVSLPAADPPRAAPRGAPIASRPALRSAWRAGACGLVALAALFAARPISPPRIPMKIQEGLGVGPHAGVCDRCHSMHAADGTPQPYALKRADDNGLCDECHETYFTPGGGGSYGGSALYRGSSHGSEHDVIWPGPDPPPRSEADATGKCLNCHDAHGWTDATGLVPFLGFAREENLCLTCHDGSPGSDVRIDLLKGFAHPTTMYSDRHSGPDETQPSDYAVAPTNRRHAECVDCHNPHVARNDGIAPPPAPNASKRLLATSRVVVLNGAAGTAPAYTFVPGSDTLTAPVAEYQLCFKCHSSWTTQPTGQSDLALLLNPNNASYHPVEAAGRDLLIPSGAFEPGWSASSLTLCSDCHRSDSGALRGPHGSLYPAILPRPYDPSPLPRPVMPDEACFACHSNAVYADSTSIGAARALSRFNEPCAAKGHVGHAAAEVPCGACHVTHGSATQPHLIVTGRSPGIVSINWTPNGATCTPTCHATETYTVNYGR